GQHIAGPQLKVKKRIGTILQSDGAADFMAAVGIQFVTEETGDGVEQIHMTTPGCRFAAPDQTVGHNVIGQFRVNSELAGTQFRTAGMGERVTKTELLAGQGEVVAGGERDRVHRRRITQLYRADHAVRISRSKGQLFGGWNTV